MATLNYREREAAKRLAYWGTDDEVGRCLLELAVWAGLLWLAHLPPRTAREAVVGLALWDRHREYGGRMSAGDYLALWAHQIEPEGRIPSPEGKNALAAFLSPLASPPERCSY